MTYAPVAQLDRVLGYELRGRRFESFRARQIKKGATQCVAPFFNLARPEADENLLGSTKSAG
jgi:hypothetical protein